jgi:tRNA threonylcarbamoyladenosine biosynthesis protein TsaB
LIVLSIDTCLGACSCAVVRDGEPLAAVFEPMTRGHQERLAPMVEAAMKEAGIVFADLDRIAVTVGPGSFTGLRVGVAFAKGLGLALDRSVVGVGSLEALGAGEAGRVLALADARRGQVYWQAFEDGAPLNRASASTLEDAAGFFVPDIVTGPGADLLAGRFPGALAAARPAPDPVAVARLGAARLDPGPLRPLYLRTPDAKLPGGVEPEWPT